MNNIVLHFYLLLFRILKTDLKWFLNYKCYNFVLLYFVLLYSLFSIEAINYSNKDMDRIKVYTALKCPYYGFSNITLHAVQARSGHRENRENSQWAALPAHKLGRQTCLLFKN